MQLSTSHPSFSVPLITSFFVALWVLLSVLKPPGSLASSCSKYGTFQEVGILVQLLTGCFSAHLPWKNISGIMFRDYVDGATSP